MGDSNEVVVLEQTNNESIICEVCYGENISITSEQVGGKTKTRKMGCLWRIGRMLLVFLSLGLWLVVGKRKATSTTQFQHATVAICQSCGNKWTIKTHLA